MTRSDHDFGQALEPREVRSTLIPKGRKVFIRRRHDQGKWMARKGIERFFHSEKQWVDGKFVTLETDPCSQGVPGSSEQSRH